jgi:hypothetical protein
MALVRAILSIFHTIPLSRLNTAVDPRISLALPVCHDKLMCPLAVPQLRPLIVGFTPRRLGFEPRSGHMGFMVDKVELGRIFLRVFLFPIPILIPSTAPYSSSIIGDWLVADVPSRLSLTPRQNNMCPLKGRIFVRFFPLAGTEFLSLPFARNLPL